MHVGPLYTNGGVKSPHFLINESFKTVVMSKEVDLYDYIRRYYIVRDNFYYPKISVGMPKKLTFEEVKKEFEKRKQMPD